MASGDKVLALVHSQPLDLCSWATLVSIQPHAPYPCACLKWGWGKRRHHSAFLTSSLRNLCLLELGAQQFQEERPRPPTTHPSLHRISLLLFLTPPGLEPRTTIFSTSTFTSEAKGFLHRLRSGAGNVLWLVNCLPSILEALG